MTTYGVTAAGFVPKRLADVKAEWEETLKDTFGAGVNLSAESPLGQIVGIAADREASLWELAEATYNAAYPDTAEGVPLDNVVALTGVYRLGKTYSKVTAAIFYGTAAATIPQGSVVSVSGNSAARFLTVADLTINAAVLEVQKVTFDHVPTGGAWKLTNGTVTTGSLAYNANAAAVQAALRLLTGLASVTVTGDYTAGFTMTFAGTVGDQAQMSVTANTLTWASGSVTPTASTLTPGLPAQVTGDLIAETAGAVSAPAGSLTVIETPQAGWSSVTNPTDAAVGLEIESDAALKIRRKASVQKAGAGTVGAIQADLLEVSGVTAVLVFENTTMSTDGAGRPAKSFETVVQGGDDAAVAAVLWADKPAGIATFGTTTVSVTDSQGVSHDVNFSRPTEKDVYVDVTLETNIDFPTDGDTLVKDQVLAYGATLTLGDDVTIYPAMMGFLAKVPGITRATVKIGLSASPSSDANIAIDTFEVAAFDTSRITVEHA